MWLLFFGVCVQVEGALAQAENSESPTDIVWSAPMFAPWVWKTDTGYDGILYNVLLEASRKANVNLVVKPTPILRMYADLDSGSADFSVIPILDPETQFFPSKEIVIRAVPIFQNRAQVFAHRERREQFDFSHNEPGQYRLGSLSIPERLKKLSSLPDFITKETDIIGYTDDSALAKGLKAGRIDLALASALSFLKAASDLGIADDFYEVQSLSFLSGTYVIWSKQSDKTLDSDVTTAFFDALSEVSCDGTVERVFKAWIAKEFDQSAVSDDVLQRISDAIVGYCDDEPAS